MTSCSYSLLSLIPLLALGTRAVINDRGAKSFTQSEATSKAPHKNVLMTKQLLSRSSPARLRIHNVTPVSIICDMP